MPLLLSLEPGLLRVVDAEVVTYIDRYQVSYVYLFHFPGYVMPFVFWAVHCTAARL